MYGNDDARRVELVELIVEEEEALIALVDDPALVAVAHAIVARAADDLWLARIVYVEDRERALVERVAHVRAVVPCVRPDVREALRVVHVSVRAGAAHVLRRGRVRDVKEDEPGGAAVVPRQGADGRDQVLGRVRDDVVRAPERKAVVVRREVVLEAEVLRRRRERRVKQLRATLGGVLKKEREDSVPYGDRRLERRDRGPRSRYTRGRRRP
jgi:hypothetical protein